MNPQDTKSAIVKLGLRKRLESIERIGDIDDLLREGTELGWVAKFIQGTLGLMGNVDEDVLIMALADRQRIISNTVTIVTDDWPAAQSLEDDEPRPPGRISAAQYKKAARGIDLLLETESLYLSQRDRLDWLMKKEKETGLVIEDLHKAFQAANGTLESYAGHLKEFGDTMAKARMHTGIQGAETELGKKVVAVMSDPEKRHKILTLFKRLAQAAALPPGEPPEEAA